MRPRGDYTGSKHCCSRQQIINNFITFRRKQWQLVRDLENTVMKKIYRVQLALSFNTRNALLPFLKARDEILGKSEFIFASSDQEAINIYDSIHEDAVSLWDDCYNVIHFPRILNKKDPNFDSYHYINGNMTYEELRHYAPSDMFLEYCKDRLYPINVVIDGE